MKVLIPLAGYGTRLRPHTFSKPKPLINVAGKPVLGHLLDKLADLNVDEYIFVVGHLGDQVEDYVRNEHRLPARFIEQKEMLGQAHAIWLAREHLDDDPVFVIFVDTLFETDLTALDKTGEDATIFVKEVEDPRRFGVVSLNDQGHITRFVEKPSSMDNRLVVVGLYYFAHGRPLIEAIETLMARKIMTKNEYFLADAMQLDGRIGPQVRHAPRLGLAGLRHARNGAGDQSLPAGTWRRQQQIICGTGTHDPDPARQHPSNGASAALGDRPLRHYRAELRHRRLPAA